MTCLGRVSTGETLRKIREKIRYIPSGSYPSEYTIIFAKIRKYLTIDNRRVCSIMKTMKIQRYLKIEFY